LPANYFLPWSPAVLAQTVRRQLSGLTRSWPCVPASR
jgi:hypothetical protein